MQGREAPAQPARAGGNQGPNPAFLSCLPFLCGGVTAVLHTAAMSAPSQVPVPVAPLPTRLGTATAALSFCVFYFVFHHLFIDGRGWSGHRRAAGDGVGRCDLGVFSPFHLTRGRNFIWNSLAFTSNDTVGAVRPFLNKHLQKAC